MALKRVCDYWTIEELCTEAASVLAKDCPEQASRRVRNVPDIRTVRYYTTLGLIDPPDAWSWRVALYGRRQLLQLVAIKRLQTQGLALAEIQEALIGETNAELEKLARLPASVGEGPSPTSPGTESADSNQRAEDFWREPAKPGKPTFARAGTRKRRIPDPPEILDRGESKSAAGEENGASPHQQSPSVFLGVPLTEDVTLAFSPRRSLTTLDVEFIRAAAGPLLKLLQKRQLL